MPHIEETVASALMRWRLIERAVHDHESWSFRYRGVTVPITRFIRDDRVSFSGFFPAFCPLGEAQVEPVLELLCGGELVRTITLADPLCEDGSSVWWDLIIVDHVHV